jgi:hypothetical protein
MRVLLHIGMPKTGSTALQDCLLGSHDQLLSRGVLYPKNAGDVEFNNHKLLVHPLLPFERHQRHLRLDWTPDELAARHASFLATVAAQVAAARPDCLVLSSETLFRKYPPGAEGLLKAELAVIGAEGPVTVAAYLRRPSERYLSGLQQRLKASWQVNQPLPPTYRRTLEQYGGFFGADAIRPRVFAPGLLAGADIVTDFCAAYLPEFGLVREALADVGRVNEASGGEAMEIQRRYRWDFHRMDDDHKTLDSELLDLALAEAEAALGAQRPRLRPGIADVVDYATDEPLWLRDTYGLEFPGYDCARLERDGARPGPEREYRLHELVEIDAGMMAALLAHLAGSAWAREEAARGAWIAGLLADRDSPAVAAIGA